MKQRHKISRITPPWARMLRAAVILSALSLFAACTADNSKLVSGNDKTDTGIEEEDTGWSEPDIGEPDATEPDVGEPSTTESLAQRCAAAGSTSGGGYSVTHCTAPAQPSVGAASGGGYRVELGTLRAVIPE